MSKQFAETVLTDVSVEFTHRDLIDEILWDRLTSRIMRDEGMPRNLAERILDQTLGYLRLASIEPEGIFSPSSLVDIGWHTFILYTRDYAEFCGKLTGGHFIHHEPTDNPTVPNRNSGPYATVEAMKAHGLSVDEALWICLHGDDCSNCNGGQGCQCGSCNY